MPFRLKNVPLTYQPAVNMAFMNTSRCSWNCSWMTSMYSTTSTHILPNFSCVLTNAKNSLLVWIWRNACFGLFKGHTWVRHFKGNEISWFENTMRNHIH
jgi:hypothetical protein